MHLNVPNAEDISYWSYEYTSHPCEWYIFSRVLYVKEEQELNGATQLGEQCVWPRVKHGAVLSVN